MSDTIKHQISVVIPCLNEASCIVACIEHIKQCCAAAHIEPEIIIADNNSTDNSAELARQAGARVVPVATRGYGAAVHGGIMAASHNVVVFADADCSYPFTQISELITPVEQNEADIVLGNRLKGHMQPGAMPWLHRYVGTPVLSALIRILHHIPVYDCNGGMRALSREKYPSLGMKCPGMEYASEMLIRAARAHWRYREIALDFRPAHPSHKPHLRTWRDGKRHLITILKSFLKRDLF